MLTITPLPASACGSMVPRLEDLLAGTFRIYHHDLEEVFEVDVEEFHQGLPQFGSRPACARLERGNIVLADVELAGKLALRETSLLAHRPQPGRPDLHIHSGIFTRTRIFVKTCLQKGLDRPRNPVSQPAS